MASSECEIEIRNATTQEQALCHLLRGLGGLLSRSLRSRWAGTAHPLCRRSSRIGPFGARRGATGPLNSAREGVLHRAAMPTLSLLPDESGLEPIHTRRYETCVYRVSDSELLVRAAVSDTKPPGLYIEGDPEDLEIHQMQLELRVAHPGLVITAARVVFETHPHTGCPLIAESYSKLVGLSIARGFNARVRELFGGSRGCTHTNALLQAMAPAVVQSIWSLSVREKTTLSGKDSRLTAEEREQRVAGNLNTCHVWAENGEHVEKIRRGDTSEFPPLPVKERLRELGRDEKSW